MDRAAIFAEVTRRDALRRANFLPPIDVHAEFAREVSLAREREYRDMCNEHAAVRKAIRDQVIAEQRAQRGESFGYTMGSRWMIGLITQKRFEAFVALTYGMQGPAMTPAINAIKYGDGGTPASD